MYLGRSRALVPAEDQRKQITLLVRQRRKRVHHFPDPGVQVVFLITARGAADAALARPCRGMRRASLVKATSGTGREARADVFIDQQPSALATLSARLTRLGSF
jgi:hypothetical protein